MKQVIILHGGDSFKTYETYIKNLKSSAIDYERLKSQKKWRQWISDQMPDSDILLPTMPNSDNAVYDEWKMYFEKLLPFLTDDVGLVGHSLGAMFLAIYLNDNPLPKPVRQLILIAGGYDDDPLGEYGSFMVKSAKNVSKSADEIHLFHSKDDPVVPFGELVKFQQDLPSAISHTFTNKGHFLDPTFPELLKILKQK